MQTSAQQIKVVTYSDVVFLAHFTGSGIDPILDMLVDDYFVFLDEAIKLYKEQLTIPRRVILAGIEK
jgi:hypothetical protein|nr:MAG TPA: hypothetical protein [Caudoviricetes sp.]